MRLENGKLAVRAAVPADGLLLANWWNDGKVMDHAGFPNGLGTTEETVRESLKKDSDNTRRRLIIEAEGMPIGEMNYDNEGNGAVSIGIKICNFQYQEKGIGKVVLSMLIKHLFQSGYTKVILDTNLTNHRAQHVYERLGFRKTGTKLDSWTDQAGRLQSYVCYELTEDNFKDFSVL